MMNRRLKNMCILSLGIGMTSCSHLPVKKIPDSANPTEEIDKLEVSFNRATEQQVDVLAPSNYRIADEAMTAARVARAGNYDSTEILHYVSNARTYLEKATRTAEIARTTLGPVVSMRADALKAGANKIYPAELKALDESLKEASAAVEDQDISKAERYREQLAKQYSDLELMTIQEDKLGPASATIKTAVDEGAEKGAPKTLAQAKQDFKAADNFIKANRHDAVRVDAAASTAASSADLLLKITRQVKATDKSDGETLVLAQEAQNARIAGEVAANRRTEAELSVERERASNLDAELGSANDKLTEANDKLMTDQQFNAKLASAKARFGSDEAEVMRDGDRLVIRLKAMAFPIGKANIASGAIALLGKVNSVVQSLNPRSIVVQGHTDSTGNAERNQILSVARANSIRDYFISLGASATSVTAEGLGDSRPIAPNKTKTGRAQNRRVDIIIDPSGSAAS